MLILPRLQVPLLPLTTGDDKYDLSNLNSYLQDLIGYFYSCNAPLTEQDQVLSSTPISGTSAVIWPDGITSNIGVFVNISNTYTGGNITFKINRRTSTVGNAVMFYNAYRFRDSTAFVNIAFAVYIPFNPPSVNATYTTSAIIVNPSVQPGDIVRFDVERQGTHGSDTLAGDVYNDSITVSFI